MSASTTLSRNWLFTINNPGDIDPEVSFGVNYKFLVYQLEKGENGTPHYQGYVMFKTNKRLSALKKLCKEAHWEIRRGSHKQAKDYCTKEDTRVKGPFTFGIEPEQGKRTDLDAVKESIDSGATMKDVAETHFSSFVKYERGIRSYLNLKTNKRDFKTQVFVCYGPTGTGKSMYCDQMCKDPYWYYPQKDGKWWDGYNGQSDVIIDEFYGQILWSTLLRLLDRYPVEVEVKGGTFNFAPKRIFITSNKEPIEWYINKVDQFQTLRRRLEYIMYFPVLGKCILMNPEPAPPLPDKFPEPTLDNTNPDNLDFLDELFDFTPPVSQESSPPPTLKRSRAQYENGILVPITESCTILSSSNDNMDNIIIPK